MDSDETDACVERGGSPGRRLDGRHDGGIVLGSLLAEPLLFGIDALIIIVALIVGRAVTRSPRLAWLLAFGLVVGVGDL